MINIELLFICINCVLMTKVQELLHKNIAKHAYAISKIFNL